MKKRTSFIFSVLLLTVTASADAQVFFSQFDSSYSDSRSELGIFGDYFISSDAITVEFQNTYLSDNFISNDLKDKSLSKIEDNAKLGSNFNGGLFYRKMIGERKDKSWFMNIRHRQHYNSNFSDDMFGLYFYGNKRYAGQTADISDLNYQSLRYQQLQLGFVRTMAKETNRWDLVYGLSVLFGQEYLSIKTERGSFYTHPDAEYVEMDVYLEAKQSDTTNSGFGALNGYGLSVDFMAQYSEHDKYIIRFGVTDAGFISWNSKSTSFTVDTLYHWEGKVVENIFDSLFLDIKSQDEFTDGFKKDKKEESFSTIIPVKLQASYGRIIKPGKLTLWVGGDYLINADYTPQIYVSADYVISEKFLTGLSLRYGGYAEFGAGLHLGVDFGKGFILTASTSYLTGFIATSSSTAQGATAGFRKKF